MGNRIEKDFLRLDSAEECISEERFREVTTEAPTRIGGVMTTQPELPKGHTSILSPTFKYVPTSRGVTSSGEPIEWTSISNTTTPRKLERC